MPGRWVSGCVAWTFTKVLTSSLERARRTAELAGFGDVAEADPDLMEWDYGHYDGKTTAEIRQENPDWSLFRDGCPGGESVAAVGARADRVIARLRASSGRVLLFGHGHFFRVLAARWLGLPAGRRPVVLSEHRVAQHTGLRAFAGRTRRPPLERRPPRDMHRTAYKQTILPDPWSLGMAKTANLLERYECGPFRFADDDYYDRHLVFDHVIPEEKANTRERFEAMASSIRDLLTQRWLLTEQHARRPKPQGGVLSVDGVLDRPDAGQQHQQPSDRRVRPQRLRIRRRARLADSVRARARCGAGQWRAGPAGGLFSRLAGDAADPGGRLRPALRVRHVPPGDQGRPAGRASGQLADPSRPVGGRSAGRDAWKSGSIAHFQMREGRLTVTPNVPTILRGIPYDRPVVGYGGRTINTLRLWGAAAHEDFNFLEFSRGDFFDAVHEKVAAEVLTRVLYPDDSTPRGRNLRFVQEYFLVACSLADIVARFRRRGNDWKALPDKAAVQLNDTHPAMAVAELMRILLDEAHLGWDEAWDLTRRTLAYTNHTLMPEALETWPVSLFEMIVPRLLEIIYEINRRFLDDVRARYPERPGPRLARQPDRRGARKASPHGQPGDRRHSQHQRRGRDPLAGCCGRPSWPTWPRSSPSGSTTRPTA